MDDQAGLVEAAGSRFTSLELIGQGSFGDVYKGMLLVQTVHLILLQHLITTSNKAAGDSSGHSGSTKSVMTIAFQFAFEVHLQDNIAAMVRQYVRSIIASVQRVSLALSPSRFGSPNAFHLPPGTPEAQTLARWICNSYRHYPFLLLQIKLEPPWLHFKISPCKRFLMTMGRKPCALNSPR